MIWAALAAAIAIAIAAAASGPDYWKELVHRFRKAIKEHVKDHARRDQALAILKAADHDVLVARKQLVVHFRQAYDVHLRYTSTREDYLAAVDAAMVDIHTMELAGLDHRFELKALLTPAEYQAIFADIKQGVIHDDAKEKKKQDKQDKKDAKKAAHHHHDAE